MSDAIDVMFGGMGKLAPGSDADTAAVLHALPRTTFTTVVDAGCGSGRQTLTLARELGVRVHAVDLHQPFLDDLAQRAQQAGLDVAPRRLDMADIPREYDDIDLLWSEGAAYSIGFANALSTWLPALASDGYLVVSELCWLTTDPDAQARDFFAAAYPDMRTVDETAALATAAGYTVLAQRVLPREAWTDGYYDELGPRAQALLTHPDPEVAAFATETLREIEVFERSPGDYGYVFFVLTRA